MLIVDGADIYNFCLSNGENKLFFEIVTSLSFDECVKGAAKTFQNKYGIKYNKVENNVTGYPLCQIG